ncbi:hypothetical protein MANES_06G145800v8 [Manihot esculenta]|uniref:Uncharacterized protein n=1 Tax=Manihot esculenta TaxID=3983 RepID=A0ACB7HJC5_MANES|nr:hypothetical protein MANES_06G145800v8 [Manihot esculenta]
MLQFFQTYNNLIFQTSLSSSLTLLLIFLKIPILFLQGLHTYIHPENLGQQNGVKAAIRRPSNSDSPSGLDGYQNLSSKASTDFKRRNKSKEKFEFDENNAQIFRLSLDEAHLQSRLYFNDYWYSFIYSSVALSCLLLYKYLDVVEQRGIFVTGSLIPMILGFSGLSKVFLSLIRVSFEKSASTRSDKQLSALFGVLGFLFGLTICSGTVGPSVFDFDFGSVDGYGRAFVAFLMGCLAGILYMPAAKNARAFWLGTDQLRSNMIMISCGWFSRIILYANYFLAFFTALLWINPLADILIGKTIENGNRTHSNSSSSTGEADKLVRIVAFTRSEFTKFRLWCLLLSGLIQIMALRPNLQMYLNEALLSWYQRLHASKVPDLDFSRAKIDIPLKNLQLLCSLLPCTAFVKEVTLLMGWWVIFLWAIFTSASLFLYRRGILYIS